MLTRKSHARPEPGNSRQCHEDQKKRETELEQRAHDIARVLHVLEYQAEGVNPAVGRKKPESP